ncbi:hypothetical protein K469DRAFT_688324 [Zopfia rhizophila CBS 207.26]|uniref:Transposase Tc1-like domain-containing protein n=1 Tax=Zopfia rhizophila CBS 207.26 TaxID=1314779 RepID=A0A6A6E5G8_9PEZI|nr:hypothetical protein K469DRAFT_688324 [Zopfia rhizophila CBS 207.26]
MQAVRPALSSSLWAREYLLLFMSVLLAIMLNQDMPCERIADIVSKETGIRVTRQTAERMLYEHRHLACCRLPIKIELQDHHKRARISFCRWAILKLEQGCGFIFTDEVSFEQENHSQAPNVTRPIGSNRFEYSRPPTEKMETIMFWGAIAYGYGPGPHHIWKKEIPAEREHLASILAAENELDKENTRVSREFARISGTGGFEYVQKLNREVQQLDREEPSVIYVQEKEAPTRVGI